MKGDYPFVKTQSLISEKKLGPTLRNIFRAIALENENLIEFNFGKGKSFLICQDKKISEIIWDGNSYSLDSLIDEAKELLNNGMLVNDDFAKKLLLFFQSTVELSELCRIVNILNFVITKISLYNYEEIPIDEQLARFYEKWNTIYSGLKTFDLTGKVLINNINRKETEEYKRAFDEMTKNGIALSVQNAISSLLDSIPEDVEKLLDIGSGPGYVDEAIPKDIQVLAMDIDEKILEANPRKSCLGDVLQIPLKDKSVDMTITCDMLEHIEPEQLIKACEEIKRVTKKYIYIQVPYMENLDAGQAYCKNCKREWHVNFHKNSFDEKRLVSIIGKDWMPVRVNYTGERTFADNLQQEFLFTKNNALKSNLISSWTCPICGKLSIPRNEKIIDSLNRLFKSENGFFPRYSEMGILFVRNVLREEFTVPEETKYTKRLMRKNEIDFCEKQEITKVVNIYDCRPVVFTNNNWNRSNGSLKVYRREGDEWGEFGCLFPLYFKEGDWLEIRGYVRKKGEIIISSTTLGRKEVRIDSVKIAAGTVGIQIPFPVYVWGNKALIKFYFSMDEMEINLIKIKRKKDYYYTRYEFDENNIFFRIKKRNLLASYHVSGTTYLDVCDERNQEEDLACLLKRLCQNEEVIEKLQYELANIADVIKAKNREESETLLDEDMLLLLEQMDLYETKKENTELEMGTEISFIEEAERRVRKEEEDERILQNLMMQDLAYSLYEEPKNKNAGKYWMKSKVDIFVALVYEKPLLYNLVIKTGFRNVCVRIINWKRGKR